MKKNYIYNTITGLVLLLFVSACNFEKVNTNALEITDEEGKARDYLAGTSFLAMQSMVVPVGPITSDTEVANQYQIAYHLSADTWSGYFGQNGNWHSGNNNTTQFLVSNWVNASFTNSYSNFIPNWMSIKKQAEDNDIPEYIALVDILKVSAWHKTTDMFGPIPYSEAGKMLLIVPYDNQEQVYHQFFDDLENAIKVLTPLADAGIKIIPRYDAVYGGDIAKWIKYANTLRLRLAMRVRYVDAELAKKNAELAVNHPYGVMLTKEDEAKMGVGAGINFMNNIEIFANQYNESRLGSSIFAYLIGYEDPRISKYALPSTNSLAVEGVDEKKYIGVPNGHPYGGLYTDYSKPNIEKATPTYWMRASEAYFLRAEGALIGWNMGGTPESLYEEGIAMSFTENGIAPSEVTTYLNVNKAPIDYKAFIVSAVSPTTSTTKFSGNVEEKLEKIITQKWLAMFPNGQEAWSEWRRTGYPKLHPVVRDAGSLGIGRVRRMSYPTQFYASEADRKNTEDAVQKLGGPDLASTKVWWDAK